MIFKIAWRNIYRNKKRSLITITSIFAALFLIILMRALQFGFYDKLIETRKVVIATLKVKKGNYEKVKEMLDSDDGLPTTRAYDGCSHLEATFNEETNTYFIIEYWDSFEKYDAYLTWRLNDDPSGIADELSKYLVGGSDGLVPHTNNIGYKFY